MRVCCFPVGSTGCIFGVWGHFLALLSPFAGPSFGSWWLSDRSRQSTDFYVYVCVREFLHKIASARSGHRPGCVMTDFLVPPSRGFVSTGCLRSPLLLEACLTLCCAITDDNWETKAIPKPRIGVGVEMEHSQWERRAKEQMGGMFEWNDGFCNRTCRAPAIGRKWNSIDWRWNSVVKHTLRSMFGFHQSAQVELTASQAAHMDLWTL